jgi:3-dehydroquinate synthase
MPNRTLNIRISRSAAAYPIHIGTGIVSSLSELALSGLVPAPSRVVVVSNRKVAALYADTAVKSLRRGGLEAHVCLIGDGERFKNLRTAERILQFLGSVRSARTDAVVALGGGVVGDAAGFAASIYLRGVPFIQVPTTLLSMIDSSVGGKTGVNTPFGKNLVGSFYQPQCVVVDAGTLRTLPGREITAGLCEAVKQAAIDGGTLFERTSRFLHDPNRELSGQMVADLIARQIKFKSQIVAGDEREDPLHAGPRSRKVLNFGHTLAHALEKATHYRYLKHGEAVGHGVRFAAALSKNLGLLSSNELNLLNDVVLRAGKLPPIDSIEPEAIFASFKFDKKMIGNELQWILLEGIGKPVIVPHSDIPRDAHRRSLVEIGGRG